MATKHDNEGTKRAPKGHFVVYVGKELKRFVIPLSMLKNPTFQQLLEKAADEYGSEEVELLACRKAVEFAIDAGFSELVIEGDNSNVMRALSSSMADLSLLGNVVDDVRHLAFGLNWINFSCTKRGGNKVAHALAQPARNISEDVFWMEDSPPPAMNALIS